MRDLEPLLSLARRAEPAGTDTPAEFAQLQRAVHRRRVRRRVVAGGAAVSLAAAAALLVMLPRGGDPITYAIAGDVRMAGDVLEAHGSGPVNLDFSEGTRIVLAPGMQMELLASDSRGARVRVREGRAHFAVKSRPGARWSVAAGPFTVRVVGTEFDVAWSAAAETLEVALISGAVAVDGPPPLPLSLSAGRRLVVRGPTRDVEIAPLGAASATAPSPPPAAKDERPAPSAPAPVVPAPPVTEAARSPSAAAPVNGPATPTPTRVRVAVVHRPRSARAPATAAAAGAAPPAESPPPPPSPVAPARPAVSWPARMASGDYQAIVADAQAAGLEQNLQQRSSDELAALSDAARYAGRPEIARKALLAQRRRFPGSENAASAAFHLGTLAEKQAPNASEALRWYDAYLAATPGGVFAPETLGRKMLLLEGRDLAAARSVAAAYLRQFPAGPQRRQAERILAQPSQP